ncbi:alpha/beta fold hydrolase [Dactylosporangium sucinum]|uniref:Alpha/beta hydrolase n=1 Tax=Dactylosporangium sucinum TaxID=1424081 RepID=A0A917TUI5_9ACTN|nr:alpha/beta fold hydrolase [Dactylosporangium sucinum]GGM38943.1 alpha/beta hydrolase [Dactylosporangium sucinum]
MTSFHHPGTVLTDHTFEVPLDHQDPAGERITVFAREVVASRQAGDDLPWLLFLQGGPGHGAPRPIGRDAWLDRALQDFRVLLLDQRGTGRSTRVTRQRVRARGNPRRQAEYLAHFRADAIVRDAELIRRQLGGDRPWSVLGQSFGGFCAVTYLSFAPEGLRDVMITGGLPGLHATADDVYRATYPRVAAKNDAHYARYPGDVQKVRAITEALANTGITVEAFRSLGLALGSSTGSHELHYLVEDAFEAPGVLSDAFLAEVRHRLDLTGAPLYALLHEACYAQGGPTAWAAHRVRDEFPRFQDPVLFTGEMIYPGTVDPAFAEVADLLAAKADWPALYDPQRLRTNTVPVAAAVYHDDMYVDRELSEQTASSIGNTRIWVTNEYEHDGLRVSRGAVLDRLIRMTGGEV